MSATDKRVLILTMCELKSCRFWQRLHLLYGDKISYILIHRSDKLFGTIDLYIYNCLRAKKQVRDLLVI